LPAGAALEVCGSRKVARHAIYALLPCVAVSPDPSDLGLRERKKQETRAALTWAAVRLSIERGLENVLVDDIAAAAGVSARTFNNYFSSKAEAVAARHVDRLRAMAASLLGRDPEEPLWEAIGAVVVAQFAGGHAQEGPPDSRWVAGVKLMTSEPAVQAELLRGGRAAERELAIVIAQRIGVAPEGLYPQLAAAATGAAVQVALEQWLRGDPPVALRRLLRKAIEQTATLGQPPPRKRRTSTRGPS
jgi:AcrR family transcriptional regulator